VANVSRAALDLASSALRDVHSTTDFNGCTKNNSHAAPSGVCWGEPQGLQWRSGFGAVDPEVPRTRTMHRWRQLRNLRMRNTSKQKSVGEARMSC